MNLSKMCQTKQLTWIKRRESSVAGLASGRSGGAFDGLDDLRIGGAAAEIAGEIMPDVVVAGIGMLLEQFMRHHDKARRAKAALKGAGGDERLLHVGQFAVGVERLDRGDAF